MARRRRTKGSVVIPAARLAVMTTEEVYEALGLEFEPDEEYSVSLSVTTPSRYSPAHAAVGLRARFPILLGLVDTKSSNDVLNLSALAAPLRHAEERSLSGSPVSSLDLSEPGTKFGQLGGEISQANGRRLLPVVGHAPVTSIRDGLGHSTARARGPVSKNRPVSALRRPKPRARTLSVGDTVQATELIYEWLPDGAPHVHARRGDHGTVEMIDAAGWPSVLFHATGTETLCDPRDVQFISRAVL